MKNKYECERKKCKGCPDLDKCKVRGYEWLKGIDLKGYKTVYDNIKKRDMRNHNLVLRSAGIIIPKREIPHHKNFNKKDDFIENIEIVTRSRHALIHHNHTAEKECGNSLYRKCYICHEYDDPENLYKERSGGHSHRSCRAEYLREWKKKHRRGE